MRATHCGRWYTGQASPPLRRACCAHTVSLYRALELAQAIAEQRTGEPKLELPGTNAVARRMLDERLKDHKFVIVCKGNIRDFWAFNWYCRGIKIFRMQFLLEG